MKIRGETYYSFTAYNKEECKQCAFHDKCCGKIKKNNKKAFRIKAKIYNNWELIKKNKEKTESEKGKIIYSKRMGAIEKVFGHIKTNIGYKQVLVRGIEKIGAIWSML